VNDNDAIEVPRRSDARDTRIYQVVPKFRYFIVVHAYECQNFTAVLMFTYCGRGL
jgi:hypothetical protein